MESYMLLAILINKMSYKAIECGLLVLVSDLAMQLVLAIQLSLIITDIANMSTGQMLQGIWRIV